jgi:hypothetical protein
MTWTQGLGQPVCDTIYGVGEGFVGDGLVPIVVTHWIDRVLGIDSIGLGVSIMIDQIRNELGARVEGDARSHDERKGENNAVNTEPWPWASILKQTRVEFISRVAGRRSKTVKDKETLQVGILCGMRLKYKGC